MPVDQIPSETLALIAITCGAAVVNGALGYGFSSITVPLALLFMTSRVLNPAIVLVEVVLNAYVLWANRAALPAVWRRVLPVVIGLAPGIVAGTLVIAHVNASWLKLYTFAALLPLILLQAAGYRRPIRAERSAGFVFGSGVGALYATTTISGPPLAVLLSNQGLTREHFRAGIAFIRVGNATLTAAIYWWAGLFTDATISYSAAILPSIFVGVPAGAWVIRYMDPETFRRVCMSFDAWIVGFGIATVLRQLAIVPPAGAYLFFGSIAALDAMLLFRYFSGRRSEVPAGTACEAATP